MRNAVDLIGGHTWFNSSASNLEGIGGDAGGFAHRFNDILGLDKGLADGFLYLVLPRIQGVRYVLELL